MKKNMGLTDQIIRIGVAIIITVLYITNFISGIVALISLFIIGILIVTSLSSSCPVYLLFGINTRRKSIYKKRPY